MSSTRKVLSQIQVEDFLQQGANGSYQDSRIIRLEKERLTSAADFAIRGPGSNVKVIAQPAIQSVQSVVDKQKSEQTYARFRN